MPVEVLHVEDNPGDVRLTQEALRETNGSINLSVVEDGAKAVDYLFARDEYADRIKPDLVLLDINLPKRSGFEVLEAIKKDKSLKSIPVAIFTSSKSDIDKVKSYGLHANYFIPKPTNIDGFVKVVNWIENL